MSIISKAALVAALLSTCGVSAALAEGSKLQLIIGGEAYDGPPKFEVRFDGHPLGERAVDAAIDTGSVGRFADAADKTAYVQAFNFDIPNEVFRPDGEVRVRLVNEAYGGEGSDRDRNLYLASISVNGRAVTVSGLTTEAGGAIKANETLGEFLVLYDGNAEGVSQAPQGGWPMPVTAIAAAPTATPPVKPVAVVAKAEMPGKSEDAVEVASLNQDPEGDAAQCTRDELYNVIGFNENSNDLTTRLKARLDQIIADIGPQKCEVLITGYSSTQGDFATNALFAVERAQNVLTYLRQNGLRYSKASAAGAGETAQFGEAFNANRRVVISVRP